MVGSAPHAILLCAGLGSRLLPLTADRPKCLIEVGGRTILEHQVDALRQAGVSGVTVVGGCCFERLEAFVAERWSLGERPELLFNPFYAVSSSIGSVWMARHRLAAPFCVLNGDTIYDPAVVRSGLSHARPGLNLFVEPIGIAEADDMRVHLDGERIIAVSKDLPTSVAQHRSLGFVIGDGSEGYAAALDTLIRRNQGAQSFHHAIVDRLAHQSAVHAIIFDHGAWTEIDRPEDIARWQESAHPAAGTRYKRA